MLSFIISAIKIIFLLGFLIFIHEGGHFLVAKLCKVRVNEFAIGFGPTIWKKQGKQTKYTLRLIPLGGFVSMEGETEVSEKKDAFNNASVPKRIAIVSAGAIVNILFGTIVFMILISFLNKDIFAGLQATGEFLVSTLESLKMLFTGNVGIDDLSGPVGISQVVARNCWDGAILIYFSSSFGITWGYKFTTNSSIRWRKNLNFNNRMDKKKASKRRCRSANTIIRFFTFNSHINICNL